MTPAEYKLLLAIQIDHPYFNGDDLATISILPTRSTGSLMSRFGIVMKQKQGSVSLYAASPVPLEDFLKNMLEETGTDTLDFDMLSEDSFFNNYTDTPTDTQGLFVYSSENTLNQAENESIVLYPQFKESQNERRIGQIRIGIKDLILITETEGTGHFKARFNARSIQWQYHVTNNNGLPLTDMSIASDSGIQFSSPTEVVLQNGQTAFRFDSKVLIPFRQKSEYSFDLVQDGKIILKGLPNSTPNHLIGVKIKTETILCCPMFIYL